MVDRQLLTVAQRDAIFARRAEELAESSAAESQNTEALEALVFELGHELYALPANQVHEVRPLTLLTNLPGTPAFLAGLINVRGRIVPVIDLRPLLSLPTDGPSTSVALVAHRTVHPLPVKDLSEPPPGHLSGIDPTCIRGITPGLVIVLDAERLLADPRLVVHHETLPKA